MARKTQVKIKNCKIIEIGDSRGITIPAPFFDGTLNPKKPVNAIIEQETEK